MISKLKSKVYAKEYVNQGFNASKTIKTLEPHRSNDYAKVKGTRMIASVNFKKSLEEVMTEKGLTDDKVSQIHQRNLTQERSLPASNEAINIYHKIKGNYAPEKKAVLNINIQDPQAIQKRIEDIEEELKQLNKPI